MEEFVMFVGMMPGWVQITFYVVAGCVLGGIYGHKKYRETHPKLTKAEKVRVKEDKKLAEAQKILENRVKEDSHE